MITKLSIIFNYEYIQTVNIVCEISLLFVLEIILTFTLVLQFNIFGCNIVFKLKAIICTQCSILMNIIGTIIIVFLFKHQFIFIYTYIHGKGER